MSETTVLISALPLLCVFAMLRHLKQLAVGAVVANCANVLGLIVVMWRALAVLAAPDGDPTVPPATYDKTSLSMMPFFFGIAVYCYEGVGMVLPIRASMQDPAKFKTILVGTLLGVTTVYCIFGAVGYLAFGDE